VRGASHQVFGAKRDADEVIDRGHGLLRVVEADLSEREWLAAELRDYWIVAQPAHGPCPNGTSGGTSGPA